MSAKTIPTTVSVNDLTSDDFIAVLDAALSDGVGMHSAGNKRSLIEHHLDSFNKFTREGISQIMMHTFSIEAEVNNDRDETAEDRSIKKYHCEAKITKVNIRNPMKVSYDNQKQQVLYPLEAHRQDLTYSAAIHVDVEIVLTAYKENGTTAVKTDRLVDHRIGSIPVMVGSDLCNLNGLSRDAKIQLGEDPTDLGGYFVIRSVEWIIDNLESMTYNLPREFKNVGFKNELVRSDIISKPGDNFENSSHIVCKYLANDQIVFEINNSRFKNIQLPFYVLFRALGVCDDKSIIEHITYSLNTGDPIVKRMVEILRKGFMCKYSAMSDTYGIQSQIEVLEMIGNHISDMQMADSIARGNVNTRKYTVQTILSILDKDILPHVGLTAEDRFSKVRFLGHLLHRLMLVHMDIMPSTDRDSYKNKRVNPAGVSYAKIFKTNFNFTIVQTVRRQFMKELRSNGFSSVNLSHAFESAIYGHEFERALIQAIVTGDKTISINKKSIQNQVSSQQLHRKNQINVYSALRNINTKNTSSAKQSERANEMRRVHSSTIGYVCVIQSADTGEKVGMQKQMAISAKIALGSESSVLKQIVRADEDLIPMFNAAGEPLRGELIYQKKLTKVFVNGDWLGCVPNYHTFTDKYRQMRRDGKIHFMATIAMDVRSNEIYMWVDIGRIVRPMVIVYSNIEEVQKSKYTIPFKQHIRLTKKHVRQLIAGRITMRDLLDQGIVEYISPEEQQNCLISKDIETFMLHQDDEFMQFTHLDIPQAIIGIPGLTSPYTNHNQPARGIFQTNQVKQTCGVPCLNYHNKAYKEMFVQMHNQKPLIKTLANKFIAPTGMNAIVAIMIYGGYNQDDSLIMNQGAIDRGLFSNHHFTFEKTELDKNEKFINPDPAVTTDIKPFSNYSKLINGMVPVGTYVECGDVIIGKVANLNKADQYQNYKYYDKSVVYKYKEPAYVWDVITGRNEDDTIFCKVVFRSVRNVEIGNKFSSRAGQKGTVGMIYRDSDMPFTEDGVKPDIIFNPHSLPSRMTMGVILEGMQSKINAMKGTITDATIFRKTNIDDLSGELEKLGFAANGTQRLYNGMTGKFIDAQIFIGPIYYQCLQKFTVDTIYAHTTCPTDATTRQPLDGKASSGGLRAGEMESWTMSVSAPKLLAEKMRDHSDGFDIYVCRGCNRRAVVNERKRIFKCKRCGDKADIVKIKSTWSCKLFMDELEAANVGMKLYPKQTTFQSNQ